MKTFWKDPYADGRRDGVQTCLKCMAERLKTDPNDAFDSSSGSDDDSDDSDDSSDTYGAVSIPPR